jgi:hypothetical protein
MLYLHMALVCLIKPMRQVSLRKVEEGSIISTSTAANLNMHHEKIP